MAYENAKNEVDEKGGNKLEGNGLKKLISTPKRIRKTKRETKKQTVGKCCKMTEGEHEN